MFFYKFSVKNTLGSVNTVLDLQNTNILQIYCC